MKVGTIKGDASFDALCQHDWGREPKQIVGTAGENNHLGPKRIEKPGRVRMGTAVMGRNQEELLRRFPVLKESRFYGLIDIPRQDQTRPAMSNLQDQRHVVQTAPVPFASQVIRAGVDDAELAPVYGVGSEKLAQGFLRDPAFPRNFTQFAHCLGVFRQPAFPEAAHVEMR